MQSARGKRNAYEFEMPDGMQKRLLDLIQTVEGKVILCGYRSRMYSEALSDWHYVERPHYKKSGNGRRGDTVECLWMNFKPLVQAAAA